MQGLTVVFNSFSVEPNKNISSVYNPFNTSTSIPIKTPSVIQNDGLPHARLVDIKQLNKNKFLLVAEGNLIKTIERSQETHNFELETMIVHEGAAWNVFNKHEWTTINSLKEHFGF